MRLNGTPPLAILRRIVRFALLLFVLVAIAMFAIGSADRACPEIDPDHTTIRVEREDECRTTLWVCPRGSQGENLGPGYNLHIIIVSTGTILALEDLGDGTYRAVSDECLGLGANAWEFTVGCTETLTTESVETPGEMHDPQISLTVDVDSKVVCHPGGDVTYTYNVVNTGDDPLHDVVVVDDNGTPGDEEQARDDILPAFVSGDEDEDGILDVDETWIFQTTQNRTQDTHTTATVSASGTVHPDQRISASAAAAVDLRRPAIDILLTVSAAIVRADEFVFYTCELRNIGDDPLTNVQLVIADIDGNPVDSIDLEDYRDDGILHAGATFSCERSRQLSCTTVIVAEATGKDSCGNPLAAESTIEVEVIRPAIEANAFATPMSSECPTQIAYTCEIRNAGDVSLTDVIVQGNSKTESPFPLHLTSGDNGNQVFDVGEVWIYEALVDRDTSAVTSLHASGVDPAGRPVDCVSQVAIEILISSWHIEAEAEPVTLYAGNAVTHTYRACNDGETALHELRVLLDDGSDVTAEGGPPAKYVTGDENSNDLLDPGECWVFSADLVAAEDISTRGEASAFDPCGNPVFAASDPVSVNVIHPALTLQVWVEPEEVYPKDEVVSTYELTNTGDDPLRNVSLIDSNGDGPPLNPSLTRGDDGDLVLNVGESWTYVCRRVPAEDTLGIVKATAQDSLQQSVSASSEYAIDVMTAELSVSRTMIPIAANKGDRVTFRYEVTNQGDVPVEEVLLSDDSGTPDDAADDVHPTYVSGDDGDRILDVGEVWVYELSAYLSEENLAARAAATGAHRREGASIRMQPITARIEKLGLGELQNLRIGTSCEELTFVIPEYVRTWNPLLVDPYTSFMTTIHRGLARRNPVSGSAELDLARSIEVLDYQIIVRLHEGLRWSDGEPFTAEDVAFTYDVLFADIETDVPYRDLFDPPPLGAVDPDGDPWEVSILDAVELCDEYTVAFYLWGWPSELALILDQAWDALRTPILPKHALEADIEKYGLDRVWSLGTEPQELVGMGPYIVAEYSDAGTDDPYVDRVVLERNPYYTVSDHAGTPLPYADRVEFRTIGTWEMEDFLTDTSYHDGSEAFDAITLWSGDFVNMAWEYAGSMEHSVYTGPLPWTTWLVFNQNARPDDDRVVELCRTASYRQAIAHLIDRDELEWFLMDLFPAADSSVVATSWSLLDPRSPYHYDRSGYGEAVSEGPTSPYPFDPSEAARLLEEAGLYCEDWCESDRCCWWELSWNEGVELGLGCRSDYSCSIANQIGESLYEFGLGTWIEEVSRGHPFDLEWELDASLVTTYNALHLYELNRYLSPYGSSRFWSSLDERDHDSLTEAEEWIWELLDYASSEADPNYVFEIYKELQTLFAKECVMIPIAKVFVTYAIDDDVHNAEILFEHYPGSSMGLEYVYRAPE